MSQVILYKEGHSCQVTEGDNLHRHLLSVGWRTSKTRVTKERVVVTEEVTSIVTEPVEYPSLSMGNNKDEIIGTMTGLGIPARPDMTKEALLDMYEEYKTSNKKD